jgi:hypothetical protein
MKLQIMKKHLLLLLGISLLSLHPALAQNSGPVTITALPLPPPYLVGRGEEEKKSLPRFDLDFPGGTPGDLVKAIEKATYRPAAGRADLDRPNVARQGNGFPRVLPPLF